MANLGNPLESSFTLRGLGAEITVGDFYHAVGEVVLVEVDQPPQGFVGNSEIATELFVVYR